MSELTGDEDVEVFTATKPLVLQFPTITWNDKDYSSIRLTEPTAKQMIACTEKANAFEGAVTLVQLNAGIPPQVALQLGSRVLTRASAYFEAFSPPSPETPKPKGSADTGEG